MAVVWGVHAVVCRRCALDERGGHARNAASAQTEGFAGHGEEIVVAAGVPFGHSGTTNALRVATVR